MKIPVCTFTILFILVIHTSCWQTVRLFSMLLSSPKVLFSVHSFNEMGDENKSDNEGDVHDEPKNIPAHILAIYLKNNWINQNRLFLLDCQSSDEERKKCRIIETMDVNVPPPIIIKRLLKGALPLNFIISTKEDCERFRNFYKTAKIVLLTDKRELKNDFARILYDKLTENGCDVAFLEGGVAQFLNQYPELCSISDPSDLSENDLRSEICSPSFLRISLISNMKLDDLACNNASSSSSTSSPNRNTPNHHGHFMLAPLEKPKEDDYAIFNYDELKNSKPHLYKCRFPIQIIPYLYLGNAEISSDLNCLRKNGIKYILNVTPDLPNTFEKDENFKYMQIPVDDHWSQNLSEYFPRAFEFIDEARSHCDGVLVHCWAGISRSVTVTVAYLMRTLNLSMDEAYDRVKSHKPNIAPNFSFMGQLLDYERDLYGANIAKDQQPSTSSSTTPSNNDQNVDDNFVINSLSESSATATCC